MKESDEKRVREMETKNKGMKEKKTMCHVAVEQDEAGET